MTLKESETSSIMPSVLVAVMVAIVAWSAREVIRLDDMIKLAETRVLTLHVQATENAQGIEAIDARITTLTISLQQQMTLMNTVSNERLVGLDARLQEEIKLNARITEEAKQGFEKRVSLLEAEIRRPK